MTAGLIINPYRFGVAAVVSDTFTRADSALSLGNADSGQAWTADAGTWGISSNKGYVAAGTSNLSARIAPGAGYADSTVQADVTLSAARAAAGVALRITNATNLVLVQLAKYTGGGGRDAIDLYKLIGGSYTLLASVASAGLVLGQTYRVKVVLAGNVHTVFVDDVQKISYTGTTGQEAVTNHGLWMYSDTAITNDDTGSRLDNFSVAA